MFNFERTVYQLPISVLREFSRALKTGHWSSGQPLSAKQKEICAESLQLIDELALSNLH